MRHSRSELICGNKEEVKNAEASLKQISTRIFIKTN